MNVYDSAHQTAKLIKSSDEYGDYEKARTAAYANDTNKTLIDEYKKLQMAAQLAFAAGKQPDQDDMERLKKISAVLQFSPEAGAYLLAELRLQKMLADIYKILGEAAGMDLSGLIP